MNAITICIPPRSRIDLIEDTATGGLHILLDKLPAVAPATIAWFAINRIYHLQ